MSDLIALRVGPMAVMACLALLGLPLLPMLITALEQMRLLPRARDASQRSLRTDLAYFALSPITETCARLLTTCGIAICAVALGRELSPELLRGFGPVLKQPRWLIVLEMLVASDFLYYWTHRLAHSVPALWRLHAVHHSTEHLRWSSALRAHPAEAYTHLLHTVPLFLLGFPIDALALLVPVASVYALFIHTKLDVTLRPVSYIVNTPMFHGWHHARDVGEGTQGTVNYGGFFPLFDAIFGTYHLPSERPKAVGVDDPDMPSTCVEQLAYPFKHHVDTFTEVHSCTEPVIKA
jgi:sterol desaturase/sphingolipid hydroxylase (fatty acid hydroxylase superfamily)